MKKIMKLCLCFICVFLSINYVNASDSVNFSCDYSFQGDNGPVNFRIRVRDVDKKYLKSKQEINKAGYKFWESHIVGYYENENGNFSPEQSSGKCVKDYKNKSKTRKLCIFGNGNNQLFAENSFNSDGSISCPNLYYSSILTDKYNIVTVDKSINSSGTSVSNVPVALKSMNCYDGLNDTTPTKCNKIDVGELYSDDKIECEYSSNAENTNYKLIYSSDKKLEFNPLGSGLSLDSSVSSKTENGKTYITDSALLNQFAEESKNKLTCPKYISCSCKANAITSNGKKCWFNGVGATAKNHCGVLASVNGNDGDAAGNGNTPDDPNFDISTEEMNCEELLGENLTKIVHLFITALRIVGAIIAIVNASLAILPAIKDPDKLKNAQKKCISMAIVLIIIGLFPTLIRIIGNLFGFDLSCF